MKKQKPMSMEDLLKELQGQKTVQEDPDHISFKELFTDSFMSQHTRFQSFGEFLENGNFQVETHEDIQKIPDEFFDSHVERKTDFPNWKTMLETATKEYENRV